MYIFDLEDFFLNLNLKKNLIDNISYKDNSLKTIFAFNLNNFLEIKTFIINKPIINIKLFDNNVLNFSNSTIFYKLDNNVFTNSTGINFNTPINKDLNSLKEIFEKKVYSNKNISVELSNHDSSTLLQSNEFNIFSFSTILVVILLYLIYLHNLKIYLF